MEKDPTGASPDQPGAKLDAGKAPIMQGVLMYFPRALNAVAMLSQAGADKYTWNGWEDVPDGENRYFNAAGRHITDEACKGTYDDAVGGTGELHRTAVAWNVLASLELMLRRLEDSGQPARIPPRVEGELCHWYSDGVACQRPEGCLCGY